MTVQEVLGLALVIIASVLVPIGGVYYGWLCWTGRRRAWAAAGPAFGQFTNGKNYLPLVIYFGCIVWPCMMVFVVLGFFYKPLDHGVLFFVPAVVLIAGSWVYWPRFLTPAWRKDWVARGGTASTPLYTGRFPELGPRKSKCKGWARR